MTKNENTNEEKKDEQTNENSFTMICKPNVEKESLGINATGLIFHDAKTGKETNINFPIHDMTWKQLFKPYNKQKIELTIKLLE